MNSEQIKKAIEKNSNYWEKRALENKLNIIENEEDYVKRINIIYDKANRDIEDKLAIVYARYAKENKMTLEQAYKTLPKKMEMEYKKDVMDYVEKARSGDTKWRQYLLNQSLMHKHSVLDQLRTEFRNVVYNIDMETTGGKFLEKIYANANYYEQYKDGEENFAQVDQDKVKRLLEEDWSGGGNFSDAIWKDKEKLVNALDDILIRGFAVGENYEDMVDRLSKRMETSKSNARRLIMTESARMDMEGLLDRYKKTGVKNLIFVATLDNKTSEICRAMDNEIIPIENAQIGLNVPPMHPYCRSVISPYYEDNESETRIYRDKDTGKSTKGDYKDYVDYLERHLGNKEQAQALTKKKNDLKTLIMALDNTISIFQSNKDISINPSETQVKESEEDWNTFREQHLDEFTKEHEEQVTRDLKQLLDENDMAIRVTDTAMEKILLDNKIKSRFESGTSRAAAPNEMRLKAEKNLFGYELKMDAKLRPVYGYLTNFTNGFDRSTSNGAFKYGNICLKLKKQNLENRTTFTIGDSLDGTLYDFKVPSLYTNPKIYSLSPGRSLTDEYGKYTGKLGNSMYDITKNVSYMELQYHNGVNLNDIEKVYIYKTFNSWQGKKSYGVPDDKIDDLVKALKKAKIDYEVVE